MPKYDCYSLVVRSRDGFAELLAKGNWVTIRKYAPDSTLGDAVAKAANYVDSLGESVVNITHVSNRSSRFADAFMILVEMP